jgi:hypothetical protein
VHPDNIIPWIDTVSQGSPGIPNFRSRNFGKSSQDLIELYQLNGLAKDIFAHRAGLPCSGGLQSLIALTAAHRDAGRFPLYRGIAMDTVPKVGEVHTEASISGWSLYPKVALGLARLQTPPHHAILIDRCGEDDAALYIDEWEHELIRPPFARAITAVEGGDVRVYGVYESIHLVTLGW